MLFFVIYLQVFHEKGYKVLWYRLSFKKGGAKEILRLLSLFRFQLAEQRKKQSAERIA